jgi:cardiolipin synthase
MEKKKIVTIPNILSGFRIILAFLYLILFMTQNIQSKQELLVGILVVSAITDWLDGRIARKFNMVSELGKILDPIADKLTQGILLVCLLIRYQAAKYVLLLFLVKESYMGIMGLKTIMETGENEGAMWYGKVSTAFFYGVVIVLAVFPNIPQYVGECLLIGCGALMLFAFTQYARHYNELQRENRKTERVYKERETVQ